MLKIDDCHVWYCPEGAEHPSSTDLAEIAREMASTTKDQSSQTKYGANTMESKNKIFDFDEFIHRQVIAVLGDNTSHEITESAQYKDIEQQQREKWKDLEVFANAVLTYSPYTDDNMSKISEMSHEDAERFAMIVRTGQTERKAQIAELRRHIEEIDQVIEHISDVDTPVAGPNSHLEKMTDKETPTELMLRVKADIEADIAELENANDSSETEHECNCKTPCVDCKCKSDKDTRTVLAVCEKTTIQPEYNKSLSFGEYVLPVNPDTVAGIRELLEPSVAKLKSSLTEMPDDEMPDGSVHQIADDGKFHVPSQFSPEPDSPVHARYHAGLVVVFHRQGEQIAVIDFGDFACDPTAFDGATEEQVIEEMIMASRGIAHMTVLGGLKVGDTQTTEHSHGSTEIVSSKNTVTLTDEDIANIGKNTKNNKSPRVALPGIDVPMED